MQMLTHRRTVAATLAAVLATLATIALAAPPSVPAGAFQAFFTHETVDGTGSLSYHVRDGQVRMQAGSDADDRTVHLLRRDGRDRYVLEVFEDDGAHPFGRYLETILDEVDELYRDYAEFFIFAFTPESPLHPCSHASLDGAAVRDRSVAWDCRVTGSDTIADRATTVWEIERSMRPAGDADVVREEPYVVWIDDDLGVPLRVRYEEPFMVVRLELLRLELVDPDPALFLLPESGGI
jgi:hypothetical protein